MTGLAVVKLGGSLLDWPPLPDRLASYVRDRVDDRLLVIVGGGRVADVVRGLDRLHGLGDDRAHRLALHALDLTASILAALVPGCDVVDRLDALTGAWGRGRIPVLAPRRFLDEIDAPSPRPLRASWDVTTDSIAARVAVHLAAGELALLKSAPCRRGPTVATPPGSAWSIPPSPTSPGGSGG